MPDRTPDMNTDDVVRYKNIEIQAKLSPVTGKGKLANAVPCELGQAIGAAIAATPS